MPLFTVVLLIISSIMAAETDKPIIIGLSIIIGLVIDVVFWLILMLNDK